MGRSVGHVKTGHRKIGHMGIGLLAMGLVFAAAPAMARGRTATGVKVKVNDTLSIRSLKITEVKGNTLNLNIGLKGRNTRNQIAIYYMKGWKKDLLWKGKAKFGTGANGTSFNRTVDVGSRDMNKAKILVVASECITKNKCNKFVKVEGGDLVIRPGRFIERGTERLYEFDVENKGPARSKACNIEVKVSNRVVKTIRLPRIKKGKKKQFTYKYTSAQRNKGAKVTLKCNDLARGGNIKSIRLR